MPRVQHVLACALIATVLAPATTAQTLDKELVASISVRLGKVLIHSRKGPEPPYDGEVWAWSGPELNRIAYVDHQGDLWIAHADGKRPERILRGPVTLPAWSEDGRLIAVTERKDDGARWDISVVRVPERFRQ